MIATTRRIGQLLVLLGVGSYLATGRSSVTALIPAIFGAIFLVLATIARRESARRHAMHAAVALALLGLLATLGRLIPALSAGDFGRAAVLSQLAFCAALAVYIVLGVQSFIAARRARKP